MKRRKERFLCTSRGGDYWFFSETSDIICKRDVKVVQTFALLLLSSGHAGGMMNYFKKKRRTIVREVLYYNLTAALVRFSDHWSEYEERNKTEQNGTLETASEYSELLAEDRGERPRLWKLHASADDVGTRLLVGVIHSWRILDLRRHRWDINL